jgi:hypothetical protein
MYDIFSLPPDKRQEFVQRDKELVDEYFLVRESFNESLNDIRVYSGSKDSIESLIGKDENPLFISSLVYPISADQRSFYIVQEEAKQFGLELKDIYQLNSRGYRSDEFSTSHDGLHILFAGCSVTFGHGLLLEHTWPRMVYDNLSSRVGVAGYYNVSKLGASRIDVLLTIEAYIKTYGVPDIVLINFPNSSRDWPEEYSYDSPIALKAGHTVEALYENLVSRISDRGGVVASVSWSTEDLDSSSSKSILFNQETFLSFKSDDLNEYIYNYLRANSSNDYLTRYAMKSMDLAHPGIAEQAFYANLFTQQLIDVV